jgi:hypothetical protein
MHNRVGDKLPTPEQIKDWHERLDSLFDEMRP